MTMEDPIGYQTVLGPGLTVDIGSDADSNNSNPVIFSDPAIMVTRTMAF